MTTKKIKELGVPADKQVGEYTAIMSFSVPVPTRDLGNVSVRLTDQNGKVLWGPYLITKSPTGDITATFSHTNLTKVILSRYLSNAYGVTSHKFKLYWNPSIITTMNKQEFINEIAKYGEISLLGISDVYGYYKNQWCYNLYDNALTYGNDYIIRIYNIKTTNPPQDTDDVSFYEGTTPISVIDEAWALARINKLPFVEVPTATLILSPVVDDGTKVIIPDAVLTITPENLSAVIVDCASAWNVGNNCEIEFGSAVLPLGTNFFTKIEKSEYISSQMEFLNGLTAGETRSFDIPPLCHCTKATSHYSVAKGGGCGLLKNYDVLPGGVPDGMIGAFEVAEAMKDYGTEKVISLGEAWAVRSTHVFGGSINAQCTGCYGVPTKMNKQEFINEIAKKGEIDIDKLWAGFPPKEEQWNYDEKRSMLLYYCKSYQGGILIGNINIRNPPELTVDISFFECITAKAVEELDRAWLLARINKLPFKALPKKTVTFASVPAGATVQILD